MNGRPLMQVVVVFQAATEAGERTDEVRPHPTVQDNLRCIVDLMTLFERKKDSMDKNDQRAIQATILIGLPGNSVISMGG